MKTNFLTLSFLSKLTLVSNLQLLRVELKKASIKKRRVKGTPKPRKQRKVMFFNDNIEKMFQEMNPEMQEFVRKGGKQG